MGTQKPFVSRDIDFIELKLSEKNEEKLMLISIRMRSPNFRHVGVIMVITGGRDTDTHGTYIRW